MAVDYAQMMQSGRNDDTAAAKATVFSFERVKPKRLTKKSKGALLRGRNAEKKTMAKKKRTAKQIAATKKLIAHNRREAKKHAAGGSKKGGRKTVRVSNRRSTAAAVVTAREVEPSKSIVVYREPKRVIVTRKAGTKGKGKKKTGRKNKGRTKKQIAATNKLIRLNKARSSGKSTTTKTPRSASKRSSSTTKRRKGTGGKRRAKAIIMVSAGENKPRKRSKGRHHRKGAMENPLTGVELLVGTLTGLMGFGTADVVDRIIATHVLTGVTSGTMTAYTDVPPTASPAQGTKATYGSLFNSTAVCAPMNITRWLSGLAISGTPILIGHFVSAPVGRSALQFFGFGALMRVAGKGLIDVIASLSKTNMTGMRLYSGEQRAAAVLANDGTAAQLPAQAMTGLGRARIAGSLGAPTLKMHNAGCGCGNCKGQPAAAGAGYPSMPAPQMQSPASPPVQAAPPVANTNPPTEANIAIRGVPRSTTFHPRPGMYQWGEKAA